MSKPTSTKGLSH